MLKPHFDLQHDRQDLLTVTSKSAAPHMDEEHWIAKEFVTLNDQVTLQACGSGADALSRSA
jgi:hypothetical protein